MKKFFVIGEKTSKSLSPTIFNHWFKKYNIKAQYNFIEIRKKNFNQKISEILNKDKVTGINVTIPFKKDIIPHLHNIDRHSKTIKAVKKYRIKDKVGRFLTQVQRDSGDVDHIAAFLEEELGRICSLHILEEHIDGTTQYAKVENNWIEFLSIVIYIIAEIYSLHHVFCLGSRR